MKLNLSYYELGYITAMMESCGKLKLLETRNPAKYHKVPIPVLELLNTKKEVLDKVLRILGMRKSLNYKKSKNKYSLIIGELILKELLPMIGLVGHERRQQAMIELMRYKDENNIKFGQPFTEEQKIMMDVFVKRIYHRDDA
jgi:hypothetical protein